MYYCPRLSTSDSFRSESRRVPSWNSPLFVGLEGEEEEGTRGRPRGTIGLSGTSVSYSSGNYIGYSRRWVFVSHLPCSHFAPTLPCGDTSPFPLESCHESLLLNLLCYNFNCRLRLFLGRTLFGPLPRGPSPLTSRFTNSPSTPV